MEGNSLAYDNVVDVLVIGSGGSAFTSAIACKKSGLNALMVEKTGLFGGTTCFSGGVLWLPGNRYSKAIGPDTREAARAYIQAEAGNRFNAARVDAFLDAAPQLLEFLERETEVRFYGMPYPEYHQDNPGVSNVRSVGTLDYPASKLGPLRRKMRRGLTQQDFLGLAVGSNVEMRALMGAGRSLAGFAFVARKFGKVVADVVRYGRPEPVVRGRALIARLARTAADLDIPLWLNSPAVELIREDGAVVGAVVQRDGRTLRIRARHGVVLAAGGFPHDEARTGEMYAHKRAGRRHVAMAPPGNTGDGARMAEAAGGRVDPDVTQPAAWMPVSLIPGREGAAANWQHIVDRQKPGFIAVTRAGKRFTNESQPYHDFVPAMVEACEDMDETCAFLVCDTHAIKRYGMGFAKPDPVPRGQHVRSGYLIKGDTLAELAERAGIDGPALERTVERFNSFAASGADPDFRRGENAYDVSQGDPDHKPSPNLAPLTRGPFYAVKLLPGDIGTFAGISTNEHAQVITRDGQPIRGLYAAGNDCANVVSGGYAGAGGTLGPGMTFAYLAAQHIAGNASGYKTG